MSKKHDVILIKACVAAGKGTLIRQFKAFKDTHPIGVSDIFRHYLTHDARFAAEVAEMMTKSDDGVLVDDDVTVPLISRYFQDISVEHGEKRLILDGFGRTLRQVEELDRQIRDDFNRENYNLVTLDLTGITLEMALARGERRRKNAEALNEKPRNDDRPEVITKRYEEYIATHDQISEALKKQGDFFAIDASKDPFSVLREAIRCLGWEEEAKEIFSS